MTRQLCRRCGKRPALARVNKRGQAKVIKGHDLCRQCFRSETESARVKGGGR